MQAKPGDYFKRQWADITIYGYVFTKEEFLEQERSLGADEVELHFQSKAWDRWIADGLLYGHCYSVACIQGEYGSTPRNTTTKISKDEFERARASDWDPE